MALVCIRDDGLTITKELGALPREGLRLETKEAGVVRDFHLAGAGGSPISFGMNRVAFTARFAAELVAAQSPPS